MIKLSLLLVILLSTLIPFTVFGDTVCVEWDERPQYFQMLKAIGMEKLSRSDILMTQDIIFIRAWICMLDMITGRLGVNSFP